MNIFNSYLLVGINSINNFDICRASTICLDDIICSTGIKFKQYVETYSKITLNIISDNNINKNLKIIGLGVISELFLYCKEEAFKFSSDVMKVIDYFNYIMELKEKLLGTMGCIFIAFKDRGEIENFVPYAKIIMEFIYTILKDEEKLNNSIIKNALYIIDHFCESYGRSIKPILNIDLLADIIVKY